MGPPGSGKGTISQKWQEQEGVIVLSPGALCREHIAEKTELGKDFERYISQGQLIPGSIVSTMVSQWLGRHKTHNDTILLDGFPRTRQQVDDWVAIMKDTMPEYSARVVLFDISHETIIDRIKNRIECTSVDCRKVFSAHVFGGTPVVCPVCGAQLHRRSDDSVDVVRKRLAVYEENKAELLQRYQELGMTIEVFDVENVALHEMFTSFSRLLYKEKAAAVL